jgi:hypothetical protein
MGAAIGIEASAASATPSTLRRVVTAGVIGNVIGYGLAYAIFGGTARAVATWLINETGNDTVFAWYLMGLTAISLVLALGITDRRGQPLS